MYYSVCASALYMNQPLKDGLAEIRACGLDTFEIWSWWDQDMDGLKAAKDQLGMTLAAMCTRFVPLNDPAQRSLYLAGLEESIDAAKRIGCKILISQVGQEMEGVSRADQHQSIVDGLKACIPLLEEADMSLVIEPLNTLFDHPGYYLYHSTEAFDIVREVGSSRVKVLFDIYHQQIMEGNLIPNMTKNVEWIGHVHIAGHPGRHEPLENSEINYPAVLSALKNAGYEGAVGLEYFPLKAPADGIRELVQAIPLA